MLSPVQRTISTTLDSCDSRRGSSELLPLLPDDAAPDCDAAPQHPVLLHMAEAHRQTLEARQRRGSVLVVPVLQPYVGSTHFKSGRPLPSAFRQAVLPPPLPQPLLQQLMAGASRRKHFLMAAILGPIYIIVAPLAALVVGLSVRQCFIFCSLLLTLSRDDCRGVAAVETWITVDLLCCSGAMIWWVAFPALSEAARYTSAGAKQRSARVRLHVEALFLLYCLDRCWQGSADEVVHKVQLGWQLYTACGDGSLGVQLLPVAAPSA